MFESSFYVMDEPKYEKLAVLQKISDLLDEESDEEKRQCLLDIDEAVECGEADEGTIYDVMNGEY